MMTARIESVGNATETALRAPPAASSSPSSPSTADGQRSELTSSEARESGMAGARLERAEGQMAKMRLDLGELMVVYDDMQVGGWIDSFLIVD